MSSLNNELDDALKDFEITESGVQLVSSLDDKLRDKIEKIFEPIFTKRDGKYLPIVEIAYAQLLTLVTEQVRLGRIDEHKVIFDTYAEWYDKISKEHGVEQEVPHTAFHQISKERIAQLKDTTLLEDDKENTQ